MERLMSVEDKIKRAEEIYYRRREQEMSPREIVNDSKKGKKDIKLFKRLVRQIVVCLIIYSIFYLIINNNYIFSQDFANKIKEILNQDINFSEVYLNIKNNMSSIYNKIQVKEEESDETNENTENTENTEQQTEQEIKEEIQNNNENIGGAEELIIEETQPKELSQMEQDANYIKSTISFVKPVSGKISSMFGTRNPTTVTVPKNHTGTDIAAETGTEILSATDGKVILDSSKGDYGKHLKIQINDVVLVYAHCNKLYVKEGDTIKQGQKIAEVGATGNATGPHLHFEVRYQERYVDPQMILEL